MNATLVQPYLIHLKSIIEKYSEAQQYAKNGGIPDGLAYGIITRTRTAVEKIAGKESLYAKQIVEFANSDAHPGHKAELIVGVVTALKDDLEDGYIDSLTELAHGTVFSDYLAMAEYLLREGYKDAAAVIIGSTLEGHLRRLAQKFDVPLFQLLPNGDSREKKASQINQDLAKVAYSQFDQKHITAWLDLRNNAAHGNYAAYTKEQVEQFLEWIKDFIQKTPA